MTRNEKPQALIDYETWKARVLKEKPPQFCHNCFHYDEKGRCLIFSTEPPPEYTDEVNDCPHWCEDLPF